MLIKELFPYLAKNPNIAYFDNASTTPIHRVVLEAMTDYYTDCGATPGRGNYPTCDLAEELLSNSFDKVAAFLNTTRDHIIFTSGATQGLNWIAEWYKHIPVVIVSQADHHSVLLPFIVQGRSEQSGNLIVLPVDDQGLLDYTVASDTFIRLASQGKQALFVSNSVSNVTGEEQPIDIFLSAKRQGHITCMDASQLVAQKRINVDENNDNVDFIVFSGHKMYGPKGIGVLYSKLPTRYLDPHYMGGGMAEDVSLTDYSVHTDTGRHIAGTPNTPAIVGLAKAIDVINYEGYTSIQEAVLKNLCRIEDNGLFDMAELNKLGGYNNFWSMDKHIHTFKPIGFNSADLSEILYDKGVFIRTGNLCAHPLVNNITDQGLIRISIAPYNTEEDCIKLVTEIKQAIFKLT